MTKLNPTCPNSQQIWFATKGSRNFSRSVARVVKSFTAPASLDEPAPKELHA